MPVFQVDQLEAGTVLQFPSCRLPTLLPKLGQELERSGVSSDKKAANKWHLCADLLSILYIV
jgi:hypothetical protein